MPYIKPRKSLVLPDSQQAVEIRRLGGWELGARGIPDPMKALTQAAAAAKRQGVAFEPTAKDIDPKSLAYQVDVAISALTKHPDGWKLVNKPVGTETEGELCWDDLPSKDQVFLVQEVFKFCGEDENAANAAGFSEEQTGSPAAA